jgi:hypothetical protein
VLLYVTEVQAVGSQPVQLLKLCHISKYDTQQICFAHGLHRDAGTIHANFPLVDKLVFSVKKVFVTAPDLMERELSSSGTLRSTSARKKLNAMGNMAV